MTTVHRTYLLLTRAAHSLNTRKSLAAYYADSASSLNWKVARAPPTVTVSRNNAGLEISRVTETVQLTSDSGLDGQKYLESAGTKVAV